MWARGCRRTGPLFLLPFLIPLSLQIGPFFWSPRFKMRFIPKKCSHPPRRLRELLSSEYNGIEFLLFFKLQCQYWKIIGGAGFVYCVSEGCGLDLGSWVGCGGCGFHLAHLWTLVFTKTTSEQCPRSHAGSIIRSKPSSPFLSPSSNTHRDPTTHTHTPPRLADTRTTRLSPLPQWIFHLLEASDTSKLARLHICAIMWSRDGRIVAPPCMSMLLLACYYLKTPFDVGDTLKIED